MEEKKTLKYTEDWVGDKSSKRLTSMVLLFFSIAVAIFAVIFDAVKGLQSYELVKFVITVSLGSSLIAQGLTLPEILAKK